MDALPAKATAAVMAAPVAPAPHWISCARSEDLMFRVFAGICG
jgi:hypothetical protein